MDRTIIRNAIVISMDPAIGEHLDADVLMDSAKIAAVAPNIGSVDAREMTVVARSYCQVSSIRIATHGSACCAMPPPTGAWLSILAVFAA